MAIPFAIAHRGASRRAVGWAKSFAIPSPWPLGRETPLTTRYGVMNSRRLAQALFRDGCAPSAPIIPPADHIPVQPCRFGSCNGCTRFLFLSFSRSYVRGLGQRPGSIHGPSIRQLRLRTRRDFALAQCPNSPRSPEQARPSAYMFPYARYGPRQR
jgi:hypothetical protein